MSGKMSRNNDNEFLFPYQAILRKTSLFEWFDNNTLKLYLHVDVWFTWNVTLSTIVRNHENNSEVQCSRLISIFNPFVLIPDGGEELTQIFIFTLLRGASDSFMKAPQGSA